MSAIGSHHLDHHGVGVVGMLGAGMLGAGKLGAMATSLGRVGGLLL